MDEKALNIINLQCLHENQQILLMIPDDDMTERDTIRPCTP